jgi:molybdopterin-guanine dinucleotide biosynthesis protein A
MNKLLGVILAGGKSKRMGTDKGLILSQGKPWSLLIAKKLNKEGLQTIISINHLQKDAYLNYFKDDVLIVDQMNIPGPLDGLMSVHTQYPDKDLLLIGCDMIYMEQDTLQDLINNYQIHPNFDFYAYHNGEVWEPLCAVYTSKALKKLKAEIENPKDHSFQHLLKIGNTLKLQLKHSKSFSNINSPEK